MFVYLLHFDEPVSGRRHYMGSVNENRLHERLREHQTSNGANLTKRAVQANVGFTLAGLWQVKDRSEERKRKRRGHFRLHCSECLSAANNASLFTDVLHFAPLPKTPGLGVVCW